MRPTLAPAQRPPLNIWAPHFAAEIALLRVLLCLVIGSVELLRRLRDDVLLLLP